MYGRQRALFFLHTIENIMNSFYFKVQVLKGLQKKIFGFSGKLKNYPTKKLWKKLIMEKQKFWRKRKMFKNYFKKILKLSGNFFSEGWKKTNFNHPTFWESHSMASRCTVCMSTKSSIHSLWWQPHCCSIYSSSPATETCVRWPNSCGRISLSNVWEGIIYMAITFVNLPVEVHLFTDHRCKWKARCKVTYRSVRRVVA